MSFHDVTFPSDIAYGSVGGPAYHTDIITTESGIEKRNIAWVNARARYNVAHGVKTQAQLDALIAFFRARKGRAYGFRFKDWADYTLNDEVIGVGDGSTHDFPITKTYQSGSTNEKRRITRPLGSTLIITRGASIVTSGFTLQDLGIIHFTSAPSSGQTISVTGEFDVPVRFDTDQFSASLDNYGVHSWQDIPLIELRE
jgi:uncharacterized protein (TIGR02217 family)